MRKTLQSIAAAAALLLSSAVFAQAYVGAGVGQAKFNDNCAGTTSCSTTKTDAKFFGGYRFTPNWAAELNYFGFGKATATANAGGGSATVDIKSTAWGGGVAYFGAFSPQWIGVGRLGLARVKADVTGSLGGISASDSASSTQGYYGLGISYVLSRNLSLDAAFDGSKVKYGGESSTVRLLSVGLTYSF